MSKSSLITLVLTNFFDNGITKPNSKTPNRKLLMKTRLFLGRYLLYTREVIHEALQYFNRWNIDVCEEGANRIENVHDDFDFVMISFC